MAGKNKPVSQIKQLLLLHKEGNPIKSIVCSLGISKNTIKSYSQKLSNGQLRVGELLVLEDPILEGKFHPGNPAYKDPRFEHLSANLDYFTAELKRVGVTKKLPWEEYIEKHQQGYAYSQFYFRLRQQLIARKPGMKLDHLPANKLFIDFAGKPLHYIDPLTGELVPCQVFLATLLISGYSVALAVPSQRVDDFIYSPRCCLHQLGECPHTGAR